MSYTSDREQVVGAARAMAAAGLVVGASGNVSARTHDGNVAITRHGIPKGECTSADVIVVDLDGEVVDTAAAEHRPSVETAIHLGLLRARPDFGAVVHSHALYASMFAVAQRPIPALIDEFAVESGAEVPVAAYGISGTDELGANVVAAVGDYGRAALMANHGLVVGGRDLEHALELSIAIDRTAHIVLGAEVLGGAKPLREDAYNLYTLVYEMKVKEDKGEAPA
ncbi:MAG: class II aldolase/adducin family protein [Acidimicrobiia bacterium]|nr:class II aldolase/adducin family protein [Acidimicrobiia bacterium]